MSLTPKTFCAETTTTTGTGSYLLGGVISAGYRPIADVGNGGLARYFITNSANTKSEWGIGTYDSGANTLARTTILGNYLGTTAAVNWEAGTKNIWIPDDLSELQSFKTFSNSGDLTALKFGESSAPSTPASGYASVYVKTDGKLYLKDDAGTETDLTAGSTLDSLSDVVITSATTGDLLRYNGTNWVNATLAAAGAQPLDATLTAFAALTIAANSLTLGTGADAFSQTTFAANTFPARASTGLLEAKSITDAALSVLDDTTVGAMLDTLGGATRTGTGGVVCATSATLVTPTIGAATATTINGNAITSGTGTLTLSTFTLTVAGTASVSGTNTGDQTTISGNAATATALQTARNINGVAFDGTGNITVTAAGSTLSDTVPITKGGTGETTAAAARVALLPAMATNALKFLRVNAGETDYEVVTLAGGGDALTANPLSQFAATTSSQLAGVISDETGSGALVFGTSATLTTPTISGAITFPDNVRQTFNPGADAAGFNVGSIAGDPGTPTNGDLWYDSTANELTARINGATVSLGAGGGGDLLAANNLSDVASTGTARTNLGLTIGADVQAYNADLAALSALSGTNTIYYRSGAATWNSVSMGSGIGFSGGTLSFSGSLDSCSDVTLGSPTAGQILGVNGSSNWIAYDIVAGSNVTVTPNAGSGTITIAATTGGTPAGSDKQVQYNNSGSFGAEAGFEYDATTNTLTVATISSTGIYLTGGAVNVNNGFGLLFTDLAGSHSVQIKAREDENSVNQTIRLPIALPAVGQVLTASAVASSDVETEWADAGGGLADEAYDSATVAASGTQDLDWSLYRSGWYTLTPSAMTSTATFTFSNKTARQKRSLMLNIGSAVTGAITWPTITWESGVAPSSWASSKWYELEFWWDGTTVYGRRLSVWG